MKRVIGAAGLAATAVALAGCGGFGVSTDHEDRSYEVTGQLSLLDVKLDSADIDVTGANVSKITVRERLSWSRKMKPKPEHRTEGNTLVLRPKCPRKFTVGFNKCSVRYRVEVPYDMAAKIRNDSGQIRVQGIKGAVDAKASSGDIEAVDLGGGKVTAAADSGNIEVSGASELEANASSGNINATRLNGGKVTAKADSGNIKLSGAGDSTVKASSGNIELTDLRGPRLIANADSGNLRATFTYAPLFVQAKVDSGDIRLWLPPNESYDIDAFEDGGSPSIADDIRKDTDSKFKINADVDSGSVVIAPVQKA